MNNFINEKNKIKTYPAALSKLLYRIFSIELNLREKERVR